MMLRSEAGNTVPDNVICVSVEGAGDKSGSGWENAMPETSLDAAVNVSAASSDQGVMVWVMRGNYTRTGTLTLTKGVKLYGGFAGIGTETIASRDLKANVTTLTAADGASISIVTGGNGATSADTVLDGFTITGGKGTIGTNDLSGKLCGGGMYNTNSSPTVANCTFSGNTADYGGGMYSRNYSYPVVTNCTFSGNKATGSGDNGGGGMCNYAASPTVTNCTFYITVSEDKDGNYKISTRIMLFNLPGTVSGDKTTGASWILPISSDKTSDDYFIVQDGEKDEEYAVAMALAAKTSNYATIRITAETTSGDTPVSYDTIISGDLGFREKTASSDWSNAEMSGDVYTVTFAKVAGYSISLNGGSEAYTVSKDLEWGASWDVKATYSKIYVSGVSLDKTALVLAPGGSDKLTAEQTRQNRRQSRPKPASLTKTPRSQKREPSPPAAPSSTER